MLRSDRLGLVRVSGELMREMFFTANPGRWVQVSFGLPPEAEYRRMYHDHVRDEFVFVYSHQSFPECFPGDPVRHAIDPALSLRFDPLPSPPDSGDCSPAHTVGS